jgi:hypothetical protein
LAGIFPVCIGGSETSGLKVRLLLVVAFEADAISGPDYRFKQRGGVVWRDHLPFGEFAARCETFVALLYMFVPLSHRCQLS